MSDSDSIDRADPFEAEVSRLVRMLAAKVEEKKVSVRSLEKRMGVADSLFNKILKGKITLQVRHVLMICTALGIEWKDFFAEAYGPSTAPEAARPAEGAAGEGMPALTEAWMEEKMIGILLQLGIVDSAAAARLIQRGLSLDRIGAGESAGAGRGSRGSAPRTEPSRPGAGRAARTP
jgi:transcriptional regulator with XRE-family HTH domain